jgi:hypothetical protein
VFKYTCAQLFLYYFCCYKLCGATQLGVEYVTSSDAAQTSVIEKNLRSVILV